METKDLIVIGGGINGAGIAADAAGRGLSVLMGYVWLRGERDPQSGIYLQRGLIIFALIWIVAGWFDLFGMSMANGAHIAGLAVGLAMAFVDSLNARKRK